MNWKMIIRAAFDLTDEEWDQAVKLRELGETDRGLLMERLGPQKPAAKKSSATTRKVEHCAACDYTKRAAVHKDASVDGYHEFQSSKSAPKSARAQSLSGQIQQRRVRGVVTGDGEGEDDNDQRCVFIRSSGEMCKLLADHNIHHLKTAMDHHPFTPAASSAPLPSDQTISETSPGDTGEVHRAASSGD